MKFLHTADLHIGKRMFDISLAEDQKFMLTQVLEIAEKHSVDAVILAGDIYDRSVPSTEAVTMLDEFLTTLVNKKTPVIMISGNHDSPERVGFGSEIMEAAGLYIGGSYTGELKKVTLTAKGEGAPEVCFVCLPFIKPATVGVSNSAEVVESILDKEAIDFLDGKRYVLLTHYFVTGENGSQPELSDSEDSVYVGGIDNVPADLFVGFDYVALGHIHKPQHIGEGPIYYSGSGMKYSFSEANQTKSVNIVTVEKDGPVKVEKVPLNPYREMRCIKGRLEDLISPEVVNAAGVQADDYLQVTLTNREELIDPMGTLRMVYPNVLQILIEKNYVTDEARYESKVSVQGKSVPELFGEFYEMLTGSELTPEQKEFVSEVAEQAMQVEGR